MRPPVPVLFALILLGNQAAAIGQTIPAGYYAGFDLSFSLRVVNEGPLAIDLTSNGLTNPSAFLPLNNTEQMIRLVSSSHKVTIVIDQEGNQIGVFQVEPHLAQGQTLLTETSFRVFTRLTPTRRFEWAPPLEYSHSGQMCDIPNELLQKYCISGGPWRINDTSSSWISVRNLAFKLAGSETNVLNVVSRLVEWTGQNIRSPTSRKDRISLANETLISLEGDSDEQANLIISLCRTLGIPAYLQCGYTYFPSTVDEWSGYSGRISVHQDRICRHAWAMVYIPPWGWLPVDVTMGYSKEEPLQAIQAAAAQMLGTVIRNNYFAKDYVSETNSDGERFGNMPIRIEQRVSMKAIGISPEYQATNAAVVTTIVLAGFGAIILAVYVIVRGKMKSISHR